MPASLIPDQRPFLRSGFRLAELQESMQFTPSKFERFLHLVRGTARELGLDPTKRHVQQEPTKWRSFISKMISQEKGLKSFVGHWPIEAYFDFWTRKYTTRLASASRKRTAKVHPSRIQINLL
ncbi:hypothetical protein BT96DRAFT_528198 [Gymnopus androsaceus JB14]|uniref:Uncharacterized protein n=1 Tax=Gymnopus androsaceus JB14 TaxID=1447944 RepID=A0A6A4IM66_9AGAR|nr:hypothetical protein BT96DRAFT_528198 [Gymnopus androsaceus JB14]